MVFQICKDTSGALFLTNWIRGQPNLWIWLQEYFVSQMTYTLRGSSLYDVIFRVARLFLGLSSKGDSSAFSGVIFVSGLLLENPSSSILLPLPLGLAVPVFSSPSWQPASENFQVVS